MNISLPPQPAMLEQYWLYLTVEQCLKGDMKHENDSSGQNTESKEDAENMVCVGWLNKRNLLSSAKDWKVATSSLNLKRLMEELIHVHGTYCQ